MDLKNGIAEVSAEIATLFVGKNGKGKKGEKLLGLPAPGCVNPAVDVNLQRQTHEELLGLSIAENPDSDIVKLQPVDGSEATSVAVHFGRPRLDTAMSYSDWISVLLPHVKKDYPEFWDHQARVNFNPRFGDFQKASSNWIFGPSDGGRYSILSAPYTRMVSSKKQTTAAVDGWHVRHSQYAYLLQAAINGQTWNDTLSLSPRVDPVMAGCPNKIEHTDLYTVLESEWAIAYWSFQLPLVDLPRLLDTELKIWTFFRKEYHPDREPSGKELKDFWATVIGAYTVPVAEASEKFKQMQKDLSFIRGRHRQTGHKNLEELFQKMLPGSSPPTLAQQIRWNSFPTKREASDHWRLWMNTLVSRNQWQNLWGPLQRNSKEHPLQRAVVAGGIGLNGSSVMLNWYQKNVVTAQPSKEGKTAWTLHQFLQWFGKYAVIFMFTGVKDEAAPATIAEFGGTVVTPLSHAEFANSRDSKDQERRLVKARERAREDFQKWLQSVLDTGGLVNCPMVIRAEHESLAFNEYAGEYATLLRNAWSDLSAVNPDPKAALPVIFPGGFFGIYLDNVSAVPVIEPEPAPDIPYPWRDFENAVNQGMNGRVQTWANTHNPQRVPAGFIETFNALVKIYPESGKYIIHILGTERVDEPGQPHSKTLVPPFDGTLSPALLRWVGRREV